MVDGEAGSASAVLAFVAIAGEQRAPTHSACFIPRHLHPVYEPDDMRRGEVASHPTNRARRVLEYLCLLLQQKYERTSD